VKRFIVLASLISLQTFFFVSGAAKAEEQITCYSKEIFAEAAKTSHGEIPFWKGDDLSKKIEYRMYVNPVVRTFTITAIFWNAPDKECIISVGKNFRAPGQEKGTDS
tara:strand:+ start:335 stop:655 length:321 start_codon:yes stop_codon:yes gene_type:complete